MISRHAQQQGCEAARKRNFSFNLNAATLSLSLESKEEKSKIEFGMRVEFSIFLISYDFLTDEPKAEFDVSYPCCLLVCKLLCSKLQQCLELECFGRLRLT